MIPLRRTAVFVAAVLAMLVVVAGCAKAPMVEKRAVEVARRTVGAEAAVVRTVHGSFRDVVPNDHHGIAPLRAVWVVTFRAPTAGDCVQTADGAAMCPGDPQTTLVVLDDVTGELLFTETPAPP